MQVPVKVAMEFKDILVEIPEPSADHTHTPEQVGADPAGTAANLVAPVRADLDALALKVSEIETALAAHNHTAAQIGADPAGTAQQLVSAIKMVRAVEYNGNRTNVGFSGAITFASFTGAATATWSINPDAECVSVKNASADQASVLRITPQAGQTMPVVNLNQNEVQCLVRVGNAWRSN